MTLPSPSPVTDELLPCRECGSECRVETFGNTELIAKPFDLFVCANHQRFGGNCPSDLAYFSAENWNERPSVTDDGLVERLAADIMIALRRAKLDRGSDEAQDEFEALTLVPMIRAASDHDVLVDALKGAEAWLDRWAAHVGNCEGGDRCTCGLTAIRSETSAAAVMTMG